MSLKEAGIPEEEFMSKVDMLAERACQASNYEFSRYFSA